jgi:hypothetical protein
MNINIDLILTEWCYRLPKGYPTSVRDYEVLYHVLLETVNITADEARVIVERAKGNIKDSINESIQIDSIENQFLIKAVSEANKQEQFRQFLQLLPTEADTLTLKFLNKMSYEQAIEFADLLYSKDTITEDAVNAVNYKTGVGAELFNLEPKGMGKGEIFLAAAFAGAQAQGGGQSFDMLSNGQNFEIKDYRVGKSKSIRLGTKGSVTRFKFWDEIITTLKRIDQLRGTIENPKFDFHKYFDQPLLDAVAYLDTRAEFIRAGNLNMKDKMYLDQFYTEANKINNDIQGYTNVILRGPNATPVEMSIEPIQQSGDKIVITPIQDGSQDVTYINSELRRLEYVRNPSKLDVDLQEAVDQIVADNLIFIVFRRERVNVTRDFRYVVIDAGRIRIIEKDIQGTITSDENEIEEQNEGEY